MSDKKSKKAKREPDDLDQFRLLTSEEAARVISIPVETLDEWRSQPGLGPPAIVLGPGMVRYRLQDLTAWIDSRVELLTTEAAAAVINIPAATLRTWRSRHPGLGPPAIVMGGMLRYRLQDLMEWIDSRREESSGTAPKGVATSKRGRAKPKPA